MLQKLLPRNEHKVERVIRAVIGLAVLSLTVVGPKTLWGLVGAVPLVTAAVGSCPVYTLLGLNTCRLGSKKPRTQAT